MIGVWKEKFIDIYNSFLEEVALEIEQKTNKTIWYYKWGVNLLQIVFGCGNQTFNVHTDLSFERHCAVQRSHLAVLSLSLSLSLENYSESMPQSFEVNVPTLVFVSRKYNPQAAVSDGKNAGHRYVTHHMYRKKQRTLQEFKEGIMNNPLATPIAKSQPSIPVNTNHWAFKDFLCTR